MDSVILVFVVLAFATSLTVNWLTLVLCSQRFNCMAKKIKRLEILLEAMK